MPDNDLDERVNALEETLETTYRPIADLLPPERILAVERTAYEAHLRIAALEAKIAELEAAAKAANQNAAEAREMARAILNSRIWKTLSNAGGVLTRLAGRGGHPRF